MGVYYLTWKQRGTSFRAGLFFFSMNNTNWTQPVHPAQCRLHHLGRVGSPTAILLEERNWCRCWKTIRLAQNSLLVIENKSSKHNGIKNINCKNRQDSRITTTEWISIDTWGWPLLDRCYFCEKNASSLGVFSPDRTGTPATGGLLEDQKTYPKISRLIPQCLPQDPANVSGFQVNAAFNKCIISDHCKVTGWPSVERDAGMSWGNPVSERSWLTFSELPLSDSMSAKTEECEPQSPSSPALSRIKSVLSNSG